MGLIKTAAEIMSGRRMPPGWVPPPKQKPPGRPRLDRRCGLPDCDAVHKSNDLCAKHLTALDNWGDPYHVFERGRYNRCRCPKHPWGAVRGSHKDSRTDLEGQA